jgi:DegV family protein with EDD domain
MPKGWAETYQFDVLPIPIQIGNKTYYQGDDLTPEMFYKLITDKENHPQTAAPSPTKIKEFFEKVCKPGDTVLSINVSGKMSSTVAMVEKAANELKDKLRVIPFDSGAGSAVLAFMAREARLREKAGESIESIIENLQSMRDKVLVVLTLNSLDFAYRSGRVGALKAAVTSLLKIKPIITLQEGLMSMTELVRTRKKSIERLVAKVKEQFGSEKLRIAIVHSEDHETANLLKEMLQKATNSAEMVFTDLSISVAANLGPKTVGIVAIPEKI